MSNGLEVQGCKSETGLCSATNRIAALAHAIRDDVEATAASGSVLEESASQVVAVLDLDQHLTKNFFTRSYRGFGYELRRSSGFFRGSSRGAGQDSRWRLQDH